MTNYKYTSYIEMDVLQGNGIHWGDKNHANEMSVLNIASTPSTNCYNKMDFTVFFKPLSYLEIGYLTIYHHGNIRADFLSLAQPVLDTGIFRLKRINRLADR